MGTVAKAGGEVSSNRLWDALVAAAVVMLIFGSLFQAPGVAFNPGTVAIPIVLLALAGSYLRRPTRIPRVWCVSLGIVAFVGIYGFLIPPETVYGQDKLQRFVTLTFLTMLAASTIWSYRRFKYLWFFWVIMGLMLAVMTVVSDAAPNGRASAFDSNPVWIARAFSSSIVIAVWLVSTKKLKPWLGLVFIATLIAGLFASGSRGPLIACLVGGVVVVVMSAPSGRSVGRGVLAALALPIVALILPTIPAFRQSRIGQLVTGETGDVARSQLWSSSLSLIREHPYGVGIGGWAQSAGFSEHLWPHNMALEVSSEMGWIAVVCLTALVYATGVRLFRRFRTDPIGQILLALLITETIHVSTSGDLNARTFFFVLVLGAAYAWRHAPVTDESGATGPPHQSWRRAWCSTPTPPRCHGPKPLSDLPEGTS